MEALEITLLMDYYEGLLTQRQRTCLDLRYNQDLSLAEIAEELGVSRQAVHENITRAEELLRRMEEKTGCISRDRRCRRAIRSIQTAAGRLSGYPDGAVTALAEQILAAAKSIEE